MERIKKNNKPTRTSSSYATNVIEYCRNRGWILSETDGCVNIYVSENWVLHEMISTKPSRLYPQDFDLLVDTIRMVKYSLTPNTKTSFLQHLQKEINGWFCIQHTTMWKIRGVQYARDRRCDKREKPWWSDFNQIRKEKTIGQESNLRYGDLLRGWPLKPNLFG